MTRVLPKNIDALVVGRASFDGDRVPNDDPVSILDIDRYEASVDHLDPCDRDPIGFDGDPARLRVTRIDRDDVRTVADQIQWLVDDYPFTVGACVHPYGIALAGPFDRILYGCSRLFWAAFLAAVRPLSWRNRVLSRSTNVIPSRQQGGCSHTIPFSVLFGVQGCIFNGGVADESSAQARLPEGPRVLIPALPKRRSASFPRGGAQRGWARRRRPHRESSRGGCPRPLQRRISRRRRSSGSPWRRSGRNSTGT